MKAFEKVGPKKNSNFFFLIHICLHANYFIAFVLYDTDKNGAINIQEFASIVKSLDIVTDDRKIQELVTEVDGNSDNHIDFDEFVIAMTNLLGTTAEPDTKLRKWRTYPSENKGNAGGKHNKSNEKHYTRKMSTHETDELRLCFEKFDKNGDGQISLDELKEVMKGLGENLTESELKDMMSDADTNRDGYIDFQEFKALMPNFNSDK